MTIREKVGGLFNVIPESLIPGLTDEQIMHPESLRVAEVTSEMVETYRKYPAGAFCLFAHNIISPAQISRFNRELHSLSACAPLICLDEEGGRVSRLASNPAFDIAPVPAMAELAVKGAGEVRSEARRIGRYLREYGFDVDFAPVADVNTNPENIVIGNRAFSDSPDIAAEMVAAYLEGLHSEGICGCIKHFPGHGDTRGDTHEGFVSSAKTWREFLTCEMIPFRKGISAGAEMVMAAHVTLPELTGRSGVPSSLSRIVLEDKLRGEIGFEGVIVTDSLRMGAVTDSYGSGEAAVKALFAGADMLLIPLDYREAFDAVLDAVERGLLTESRIDKSLQRISMLRRQRGRAVPPLAAER